LRLYTKTKRQRWSWTMDRKSGDRKSIDDFIQKLRGINNERFLLVPLLVNSLL
jgi:hypothetical protein